MKKKLRLTTLIKRTLLVILAVSVVSIVLVYAFGKYAPTVNASVNKYSDSFWESDQLEGFTHSSVYYERIQEYNCTDSKNKNYVAPWEKEGKTMNDYSLEDLVVLGRYKEEVNKITADITKKFNTLEKQYNNEKVLGEWDFSRPVTDWVLERLGVEQSEYVAVDPVVTPFEYATANGFDGDMDEFIEILQYNEKILVGLEDLDFEGNIEELAYLVVNDSTIYTTIGDFDKDAFDELKEDYNTYFALIDKRDAYLETLKDWKTYYKEDLLGYGGLVTDYPNKPVLSVDKENGGKIEFWFNTYLTSFKLIEKNNNGDVVQTWYSNPETVDNKANLAVQTAQKSILNVSYATLNGQTDVYSTYEYSVSETNIYNDKLTPNFSVAINPENNTVTVWYKLVKRAIDYTAFPKYISKQSMENYFQRNVEISEESKADDDPSNDIPVLKDSPIDKVTFESYYKFIAEDDIYNEFGYDYYEYSGTHAAMSGNVRDDLLKYLYSWCGYTEEDLASDNSEFGYELSVSKAEYSLAIEYLVTENGLEVTVPGNSVKEDKKYPVTYIDILPYFSATVDSIDGYTIIPDGSGAILEHNNGKTYSKYQKRVYTTDLTNTKNVNPGTFEDLMFPMYSVVNTGDKSGLLVYATNGGAQLQLTADISGRQDSYNTNYFTAYLREKKEIIVGTATYEQKTLVKWTNAKVKDDISINFDLLSEDELSYSKVAKKYRAVLEKLYGFVSDDKTVNPVLDMDVLGAYTYRDNFIGIPYTANDSLTTIDQLNEIIDVYTNIGVKNMNVFYNGWRSTGLKNTSFKKIKVSNKIGSKAKFEELIKESKDGVKVYPYVSFAEYEKYAEAFGKSHYTTHAVDGDVVFRQPYDLNSNTYDKKKAKIYALSPRFYEAFGNTLAEQFKKATDDYNAIAINQLGSSLTGDYRKGRETFKADAVKNQKATLDNLVKSGINQLTLYTPYEYAFKYISVARDIPYQTTQYEILDYSIPFYQLVVNGMFDYSGESVNAEIGKGVNEHIMRMIETGSNILFTFTGDSSEKLIQTDYNTYYYTLYTDWIKDVENIYNTLDELGIYACELVEHESLGSNVFKVVYKSSTEEITIYLNYSRNQYVHPVDGTVVESKSYAVAK